MLAFPLSTGPRRLRKRATPPLRLALVIHTEILFLALEHAGARVSNGAWIEPLHHRAWPRRYDRGTPIPKES